VKTSGTVAPGELLDQRLMHLGRGARRRQFDIGDVDLALRLVVGLADVAKRILAENLGAGEGDFGAVRGASPLRHAQCQGTGRKPRPDQKFAAPGRPAEQALRLCSVNAACLDGLIIRHRFSPWRPADFPLGY